MIFTAFHVVGLIKLLTKIVPTYLQETKLAESQQIQDVMQCLLLIT